MTPNPQRNTIDYADLNRRLTAMRQFPLSSAEYLTLEMELWEVLRPILVGLARGREEQADDARTEILMRVRQGSLQFFCPTVFRQCLGQAGRLAFRGLPRPPKDDESPSPRVVQAEDGQLHALFGSTDSLLDAGVADEELTRCLAALNDLGTSVGEDLRVLFDYLWSGDLSTGWKGRFAGMHRMSNGTISKRLGQLNAALQERLGTQKPPDVEQAIRHLRELGVAGNAGKVDDHV